MDILFLIVGLAASLLLPVIAFSYLFLRLRERKERLKDIFTLPGILMAYLNYKGRDITLVRRETKEENLLRQRKVFNDIFKSELTGPYGGLRFVIAVLIATTLTVIIVWFLLSGSIDHLLFGQNEVRSLPLKIALLGAYSRIIWVLLDGYETYSIEPVDFYRMLLYYVVAVVSGSLFSVVFIDNDIAAALAFVVTAIPYGQISNYLKARLPKLTGGGQQADVSLSMIQGLHPQAIYRLRELGIHTTQELAYADPLMLLFRSNLQPNILIDWINQALLYNYVTSKISGLRLCGIRTASELSVIEKDDPLLNDIAHVLGTTGTEVYHLASMLKSDNQAALINEIHEVFKIESKKTEQQE